MHAGADHHVRTREVARRAPLQGAPRIGQHVQHAAAAVAAVRRRAHPQERHVLHAVEPRRLTLGHRPRIAETVFIGGDQRRAPARRSQMLREVEVPRAARTAGLLRIVVQNPDVLHVLADRWGEMSTSDTHPLITGTMWRPPRMRGFMSI
ncbi:hypothetical protein D3C81_1372700 [compost metagenome]